MIYAAVFAALAVVGLLALRAHSRRDEAWLDEQARLDAEARRQRRAQSDQQRTSEGDTPCTPSPQD